MRTYPEENPTITHVQSGPPCVLLKQRSNIIGLNNRKTRNMYAFARSHRPSISSQRSVVNVADCYILVASQDIVGAAYPQILT